MNPIGGVAVPVVTRERIKAGGCVTVAGLIVNERSGTVSRVKAACCVLLKRIPTARCVLGAKCVEKKREPTISRVEVGGGVVSKGMNASGGVAGASRVESERAKPDRRVALPTVLPWSANAPLAVLLMPVVLLNSA